MALLSVGLGMFLFGKGDLMVVQDTIYIFTQDDVPWRIASAFAFSILSMTTVAALAFLFSAVAENSIGPIMGTMAIIIALIIFTSPEIVLIQIFISKPSGYCGAHIRICQSGTKYALIISKAATATTMRDTVLSFFMMWILK